VLLAIIPLFIEDKKLCKNFYFIKINYEEEVEFDVSHMEALQVAFYESFCELLSE
jgi:hypothetical protein